MNNSFGRENSFGHRKPERLERETKRDELRQERKTLPSFIA